MKTSNLLAGILLLCCSAFAGETVIRNGTQIVEKENIVVTTTDGIAVVNPTAATSGVPVQYSPRLRLRGNAHDTDGNVSDTHDWWFEVVPANGNTTSSALYFKSSKKGAAGTTRAYISDAGNISGTSVNGSSSVTGGSVFASGTELTSATMSVMIKYSVKRAWHAYSWTNAMVVSGRTDATTSNVNIATLPAFNVISRIIIKITGAATHADTVTVSVGRTGADYIDYVVASDAKAAANTFYGDALAEIGTNLKDSGATTPCEDFAGLSTSTTTFTAQFKCGGGADINTITGSTGVVYIETYELP